jgi:putative FmdB family regulatory protein
MPIYEYVCEKCGNHIEMMQKVGDAAPKKCTKCKKGKMEKIFSRTSFQLKGGGWYASDYAKAASPDKALSADKTESKAESKSEKKSESKSEKKGESKPEKAASDSKTVPAA